jgi:uncharacterized protein (TIGR03437 family)
VPRFTSFSSGAPVVAGWPTTLSAIVVDDCGAPLASGSVIAQFSNGDPLVKLEAAQSGAWSGTWQAANVSSSVNIKLTALDPDRQLTGTAEVAASVSANVEAPAVNAGGVVNAASLAAQAPIAPGSLISIFGSHLAQGPNSGGALPWSTELGGTTVQVQGRFLPLMNASEGRIDAVLPYDLPLNTRLPLIVRRGSSLSLPLLVTIAPAGPAIFTKDASGSGQGMIYAAAGDGSLYLAAPGSPAHPGDVVTVQCTGLGAVDPAAAAGSAAPSTPIASATTAVGLNIGGVDVAVESAVLQPGMTGVYQISAKVPDGVSGDAVPVFVTVPGQASPAVTMSVR